jgi:hypothetical protein
VSSLYCSYTDRSNNAVIGSSGPDGIEKCVKLNLASWAAFPPAREWVKRTAGVSAAFPAGRCLPGRTGRRGKILKTLLDLREVSCGNVELFINLTGLSVQVLTGCRQLVALLPDFESFCAGG